MSWKRIDLSDPELSQPSEPPAVCGLIYKGKRHAISGPPEAAKTLAALIIGLEWMRQGLGNLCLIDFEMGEHATSLLLRELGATPEEIGDIFYVTPSGPPEQADLDALAEAGVSLVLVDSAAGAYDTSDLDDNKRQDAERFSRFWIKPLWKGGVTTIVLDHVVKNADNRGRYAIGSERKLGGVDVALGFEAVKQINRGGSGIVRITTNKDRPGHLPRPRAAELELTSDPDTHHITSEFKPASEHTGGGTTSEVWRPTVLIDRVLDYLQQQSEPVTCNTATAAVRGSRKWVLEAISCLVADGTIFEEAGPRGARLIGLPDRFPTGSGTTPRTSTSEGEPTGSPHILSQEGTSQRNQSSLEIDERKPLAQEPVKRAAAA